ncbi:hypothetical protein E1263_41835 [Kribbella antibiotica]|uniref:Uncharacterized protein n=1 Tax=Kribbella antibiotica TaxID=190195 RepID=A0A4R4YEL4_9ACTN|nr:hypothetical protein [Kribbella antibiotica]TDD43123.1 hypothetical protein E1263_41835 [Kribbella antibiotica]
MYLLWVCLRGRNNAAGCLVVQAMRREHVEDLYDSLVFVAFQATSTRLGRHRRVLIAHGVVQRLPQLLVADDVAAPEVFRVVVKEALQADEGRRWVRIRGLRFFPVTDALEPLQFEEALRAVTPEVRVAWALLHRAAFDRITVLRILQELGIPKAAAVLDAADAVPVDADQVFDPCAVRLAPDWETRSQRRRWLLALPLVLVAGCLAGWGFAPDSPEPVANQAPLTTIRDAAGLSAAPADQWQRTSKLDFGAWPARGELVQDNALHERLWQFWLRGENVTGAAGTTATAPAQRPSMLYAGRFADTLVAIVYDGSRIGRYVETAGSGSLRIERVDSADLMTSAAVVLNRSAAGTQYLLAPWIAAAAVRDLAVPAAASKSLSFEGGVTAAVPSGRAGCRSRIALELRSSPAVAEKHAFVLADLGDSIPAHLTYMPLPSRGAARSPREVLSADARRSWALHACGLDAWHNQGTRLVNSWSFAQQKLPTGGVARWTCVRVDGWSGQGKAAVRLELPKGPAQQVAAMTDTSSCGRFSQNVLAATVWRSPARENYVLAAGSRHVSQLSVQTNRGRETASSPLAFKLPAGTTPTAVRGKLDNGKPIDGVGVSP